MPSLPCAISSRFIDFKSPARDPIFVRYQHLQFGNIALTRHTLAPSSGMYIGAQQMIVARHCGMPLHMEWRSPGQDSLSSKLIVPGTVHVKPALQQFWQRWLLPADVLVIAFDKVVFERLAMEAGAPTIDLVGELGVTDPIMSDLTNLLERELLEGGLNGRFYVENLGAALAAYLIRRRIGKTTSALSREARLSPARLRRVIAYIDAHLDGDLGLYELSAITELNAHHFAHAFKATTGIPPHRYIIDRRISTARHRLETTMDPIADIALACGFASQSHFTQVFRRTVGITPAQYRRRQ